MAKFLRRLAWVCGLLSVVVGGWFAFRYVHRFVYSSNYFDLRETKISGASAALDQDARALLKRQLSRSGRNLCRLNSNRLALTLSGLPRAKSARVHKIFPQTLQIELIERVPVMVANLEKPFLIDEEGVLIAEIAPGDIRQLGLPMLTGIRDTGAHAGDRMRQPNLPEVLRAACFLRQSDQALHERIIEWNLGARDEITALLNTPAHTVVQFGEQPPLDRLDKLSSVLTLRKELASATYIDLRMERQIVYK